MCYEMMMDPIEPPTVESKSYVRQLKIIMWVHLALSVVKLFFGILGGSYGTLTDLMQALLLYFSYAQLNFCIIMFYIISQTFNIMVILSTLGKRVQNHSELFTNNPKVNVIIFMVLMSIIFYVLAIVVVFYAYREFKWINYNMREYLQSAQEDGYNRQSQFGMGESVQPGYSYNNQRPVSNVVLDSNLRNVRPFEGRGVQIG